MKKLIVIMFLIISSTVFSTNSGDESKGKIVVKIKGLKSNDGNVKVALCNSADNYKEDENPFKGAMIYIKNKEAIAVFDDLPMGNYAVKTFHDEDADNDFDTNFLGIPTEDYGFSNNASGFLGKPSWDAVKFDLKSNEKVIVIDIN